MQRHDEALARTAIGVALIRANESERPDRLFDDPYARALVDAAGGMPEIANRDAGNPMVLRMVAQVIVRTRFFDEYLLRATAEGLRQVVLLAAGLDARAY